MMMREGGQHKALLGREKGGRAGLIISSNVVLTFETLGLLRPMCLLLCGISPRDLSLAVQSTPLSQS
jgi:hypothetical protein